MGQRLAAVAVVVVWEGYLYCNLLWLLEFLISPVGVILKEHVTLVDKLVVELKRNANVLRVHEMYQNTIKLKHKLTPAMFVILFLLLA